MILDRGAVVLVGLDPTFGHEQRGLRPCVVVSDPEVATHQRFPMICVVSVTGSFNQGILYPQLADSGGGLHKASFALVDHVRSVDKRRIRRRYGRVSPFELVAIDDAIRAYLGLDSS